MKRKILACLLTLSLLLGLLPGAALAVDETQDGEPPVVCAGLEGCIEDTHAEGCPLYVAPDEPANEADGVTDPVGPTAAEQLAAMIAALPAPEDIEPLDEEQVKAVNNQIAEIYAFAEENGLGNSEDGLNDAALTAAVNAVIAALYPAETIADEGTVISENTTWDTATTLTGNLTVNSGVTLTIGAQVTISGDVTISGGGTIKRGEEFTTYMFVVPEGSSLTLDGITIDGGAVWNTDTNDENYNSTLKRSTTNTGIAAETAMIFNSGTLTIEANTLLQNNYNGTTSGQILTRNEENKFDFPGAQDKVQYGGAIMNGGDLFIKGGEIKDNGAYWRGGAIASYGKIEMTGGEISGNHTTNSYGDGGGFYISGGKNYNLSGNASAGAAYCKVLGGTFERNYAAGAGGALSVEHEGMLVISSGTFNENEAKTTGGAVNIFVNSDAQISNAIITKNTSATRGGGLYVSASKANLTGGSISQNESNYGGGIALELGGTLTVQNTAITSNKAKTYDGGGIFAASSTSGATEEKYTITLQNVELKENYAEGSGGGISLMTGTNGASGSTLKLYGCTIQNNNAYSGGGIQIGESITAEMTDGTISNNIATERTDKTSPQGGGIAVLANGSFTLHSGELLQNVKDGQNSGGGAVFVAGSFVMDGGTVSQNIDIKYSADRTDLNDTQKNQLRKSTGGGGAFYISGSGKLTINSGEISKNASQYGGAIALANGCTGTLVLNGGIITENYSYKDTWGTYGGGIYTRNDSATCSIEISGNPVITGNKQGATVVKNNGVYSISFGEDPSENNIFLNTGKVITLTGPLTAGASIGVTTQTKPVANSPVQITTAEDSTTYYSDAYQYFIPDAANVIAEAGNETSKYVKLSYTTDTYYKVTLDLTNITTTDSLIQNIKSENQYSTTIIADTGYTLPTEKPEGVDVYNVSGTSASVKINTVSEAKTITIAGVANTYTVKFDGNDATSGSMSDKAMTYDTAENLTENAYKKTGYNFAGWSTSANGTSEYPDGASVKNLTAENGATVTLYAVWTAKEVIPAFDSGDKAIQSYKYDGTTKEYALSSEVENFTIKYKETGSETEATETKPTTVGTYDVVISRAEDDTYAAFEQTISGGLVITAADYPVSITANSETSLSMTGSGTVKLTPSSSVTGITVTGVTCSDATISVTANGDGTYSATLPNTTKTYTFTAQVSGDLSNYGDGPATCTVSVTRSGGGSSGGSSSSTYAVSVGSTKNGAVTVSPRNASKGTTVTITVKPDSGYELDELTVTDKNGDELRLTRKSDTQYTFTMPSGKVTVEASFAEIKDAPNESLSFVDVPSDAYYADAVAWAVENGITAGTSDTTFSPDTSCTRAQMVTFLWRAAGSPKATGSNPFSDVVSGSYYYDAVLWAVENGITSGTSATTFAPDAIVTRGQTVTFLYRAAGSPATSGSSFADVSADAYYADAVAWAVSESITVGTGNNTFSPDANCTRAQIVTFMFRNAQ